MPYSSLARPAIAALMAIAIAACAIENTIHLEPEATTDSLVFVIAGTATGAPSNMSYGLSVIRCGDERPFWTIAADGSRLMPDRIVYGRPLAGFVTSTGPDSLRPGCYKAIVSEAKPVTFDVLPNGRVSPRLSKP